jgi:ribonucleoside-diphosphate reductase alpha chain
MPTASTSQILGNYECFEPPTSNIYVRRTLAGEFVVVNKHLIFELLKRNLWTADIRNKIIANDGSVQGIVEIPVDVQAVYKCAWDQKMKTLIDMAADRQPFICQSQSFSLFVADPTFRKLSSMHFYSWRKHLKTGVYYTRIKPLTKGCPVTVPVEQETGRCDACSG